jgi:hypothetical protein
MMQARIMLAPRRISPTIAAALALLLITATVSHASNARTSMAALGETEFGPAVSGNFVYWTDLKFNKKLASSVTSVYQHDFVTDKTRTIFSARRTIVQRLIADGGRVAFSIESHGKINRRHRRSHDVDAIYSMDENGVAPIALVNSMNPTKLSIRYKRVHGHLREYDTYSDCGTFTYLNDVSEAGQVFIDEYTNSCDRRQKNIKRSLIFDSLNAPPSAQAYLGDVFLTNLEFGKVVSEHRLDVISTDLASGLKTTYKLDGLVNQGEFNAAGDFAMVADVEKGNSGHFQSLFSLYPAGSTTPSAQLKQSQFDFPSVVWCAGGAVELTEPRKKPMLLTMRAMDGSVIKELTGPRSGLGYDAKCIGNHLVLAAQGISGPPQVLQYDF